jgi:hypothetical protein
MERQSVEFALQRLLEDARIAASPQMTAFICYVVEQTLDDQADRIKAYSVGVDALGKPETFDPQSDASVRVLAARLRKTLERYNGELPEGAVTISLVRGSYVPEFAVKEAAPAPAVTGMPANAETSTVATEPAADVESVEVGSSEPVLAELAATASNPQQKQDHPTGPKGPHAAPVAKPNRLPYVAAVLLAVGMGALLLNLPVKPGPEDSPALAAATGERAPIPAESPIVFIETPGEQHETARQVAFVLGGVLGQFDHLDVRQTSSDGLLSTGEIGCYSLTVSVLPTESRLILGVQVVHKADGELMFADSQDVTGDSPADLTAAIDELRKSISQLGQIDGSLKAHFGHVVAAHGKNSGIRWAFDRFAQGHRTAVVSQSAIGI